MFSHLRNACVGLLFLGLVASVAAGPPQRDRWYAYMHGDQRYGYEHVRVTELENGNLRYTTESRILVNLFGQRQEITGRGEFIVTHALRPVSLESEWTQMSGLTTGAAVMKGQTLEVVVNRSGVESKSTYSFNEAEHVLPAVCLDDFLARIPQATRTLTVKLINEEGLRVETAELTRRSGNAASPGWGIVMRDGSTKGTIICDREGVVQTRLYRTPKLEIRRCSAAEAKKIDYKQFEGRELLTFPIDKKISAPHRLKELTVELTWKDIPFDEFNLEDARQQVIDRSSEDGRFRAVVKISEPPTLEDQTPFPTKHDRFAAYLAESRFIRPGHEGIRQAAKKAVEGKNTALAAVKALSTWTNEYIEGAMIAETLSGPEVLACRKGKCTEYSTLFASLARSVGIPTRIALGERMVAGQWMGHMWNEAYVGRWIPVDASADEVGRSFGLLKFVHSDTAEGTQPLRWKLTESLNISVKDFELRPSTLSEKYVTGISGRIYTNSDFACRVSAPVESWMLEDVSKAGVVTIRFKVPEADEVLIHFVAFSAPPGTDPKAVIGARINMFKAGYADFEVMQNEPAKVSGNKAHRSRFGGAAKRDPSQVYRVTEVVWTKGPFGFLLNLIAPESQHDQHLADFEKLVQSFEGLEE